MAKSLKHLEGMLQSHSFQKLAAAAADDTHLKSTVELNWIELSALAKSASSEACQQQQQQQSTNYQFELLP